MIDNSKPFNGWKSETISSETFYCHGTNSVQNVKNIIRNRISSAYNANGGGSLGRGLYANRYIDEDHFDGGYGFMIVFKPKRQLFGYTVSENDYALGKVSPAIISQYAAQEGNTDFYNFKDEYVFHDSAEIVILDIIDLNNCQHYTEQGFLNLP